MNAMPKRVLIADDDQTVAESVKALISVKGHEVEIAADGAVAIERLKKRRFDLLLLDIMMPKVDGIGVLDFVADAQLETVVVVISGDATVDNAIKTLRRGAYDFLRKPYAPEVLLRTVENALHKKHLEQENRVIQGKLEQSEELYRYMVNSSPDIIYMLDHRGRFTFVNERIKPLLGYDPSELKGKHYEALVYPDDLDKARYAFDERRTGARASRNVEMRLKCKDSASKPRYFDTDTLPIELSAMGMYVIDDESSGKQYVGTYGVARDITERKRAEEVIRYQAFHDLLTGLPNRALFKDRLELAVSQCERRETKLGVMFLDLDRFKLVNDTLGHVKGDELLKQVAKRLKDCMRSGDTIARVGGDEFMILIPHAQDREDAAQVARKVIEELQRPFHLEGHEVFVTTSIGISIYPEHGEGPDTLIKHADIAMYHIKEQERDGFEFFNAKMNVRFSHFLSVESGIRRALKENRFRLQYQPLVDASRDNLVIGVEALVRWDHPERGMLPPNEFIPHAEECGLIVPIGEWVIQRAIADLCNWREAGMDLRLAINFSALQLAHEQVDSLVDLLEEKHLPGEALEIEITENVIMRDIDSVVSKLNRLSAHGIQISIDDFGTGYSSLGYLQNLPIDTLKIDRSFVWGISSDGPPATLVHAIVAMARGLGLDIVAEGVETEVQRDYLLQLGCNVMQGFLLGKPQEAGEIFHLNAQRQSAKASSA